MACTAVHAQDCMTLGCTMHKRDGWVCQCNFHCAAHGDCCADFSVACPNSTDPAASAGTNHSSHEHSTEAVPKKEHGADHEREAPKKEQREHTHATADMPMSEHEHESGKKEQREHTHSAANATNDHDGTALAKHSKPAHTPVSHARQGEKGTSKQPLAHKQRDTADVGKTIEKGEHDKSEKPRSERDSHVHRGKAPFPWPMVVFGCVVALTVPLTVALVLVLRGRGFCGPVPSFQPVQDRDKDDGSNGMSQEKAVELEDMGRSSGHC